MKKLSISLAVFSVSVLTIIAVRTNNKLDKHLDLNAEALAQTESVKGNCVNNSNLCLYVCSCGAIWEVSTYEKGPSYNMSGICSECKSIVR